MIILEIDKHDFFLKIQENKFIFEIVENKGYQLCRKYI